MLLFFVRRDRAVQKFPLTFKNTDVIFNFFKTICKIVLLNTERISPTEFCAENDKLTNPVMFRSMRGFSVFYPPSVNLILKNQTVAKVINADCSPPLQYKESGRRFFVF